MVLIMKGYNKKIGALGELYAEKYLKKKRYKILQKNYYIKGGEIDIIAQKGDYTVFVEVKTRCNVAYGQPSEAVTYHKRHRMIKVAKFYLLRFGNTYTRFDVIEVFFKTEKDSYRFEKINHIENAFTE